MAPDSSLTILLALKDRTGFTLRWMAYADAIRFPFKVLIADGGADESLPKVLSDRGRFPQVDYEYVRFPYDATYADYYAKVDDALCRVQTPLVALADNDDFFVVDGVRDAAQFLLDHPDYSTCGGQCAAFWVSGSQGSDPLYGSRIEWKSSLDRQSVEEDTARARIRYQSLRATYPIYYHVRRTADCREHFRTLREVNLTDLFLVEYFLWFLTAIAGKTKQLESLYIARQWNSPGGSGTAHLETFGDWFGRMLVPSWSSDFTKFVDATATALASRDGIALDEARRWVIDSYRMLVAPALLEDLQDEPTITARMALAVGMFRRLLRLPLQHPVRRAARMMYRRFQPISVDAVHGTQFRRRRVNHAAAAFEPIRQFLSNAKSSTPGRPPGSRSDSGKLL